jgi:hypothetical protein
VSQELELDGDPRSALQDLVLPPAPPSLRARLTEIAAHPPAAYRRRWWPALVRASAAFIVIALVAIAFGIGSPRSIPATGLTARPSLDALATPSTNTPSSTGIGSSDTLPNPGGTCSAGQFSIGAPTLSYGYSTFGSALVFVTVPFRNQGTSCVLALPRAFGVAPAIGPFHAAPAVNAGLATSWASEPGDSMHVVIGAWWWVGGNANGTPVASAPPCAEPIFDVARLEFPFATGHAVIELPTTWREICSSPPSLSVTIEIK